MFLPTLMTYSQTIKPVLNNHLMESKTVFLKGR